MKIGLVVPTLNAEWDLGVLLDAVMTQTLIPDDILVIDSSSSDRTLEVANSYSGVRTMCIRRQDFNHGGTRQLALENVAGDLVMFLTQDSVPAGANYFDRLLSPFKNPEVAMSSGRQLPKKEARRYVQLVQEINYPKESAIRSEADIQRLGIRAFYASDSCSAYRRAAIQSVGGIPSPCETNEDMLAAARLLRAGYRVAYTADACVVHSHNLSLREQFRRNRAVGEFLAEHASELEVPSEIRTGVSLVRSVSAQLIHEARIRELLSFGLDCTARFAGNRIGRQIKRSSEKNRK